MNIDLSNHISAAVCERAETFAKVDLLASGPNFLMDLIQQTGNNDPDASYAAFEFCREAERKLREAAREACDNIRARDIDEFDAAVFRARHLIEKADLFAQTRDVFKDTTAKAQDDAISAELRKLLDNELRGDTHFYFTLCRQYETTRRNWATGKDEKYTVRSHLTRGKDYRGRSCLEFDRGQRQEVTWAQIGTALKNAHKLVDEDYGVSEVEVIIDSCTFWSIDSKLPEQERHERNVQSLTGRRVLGTIRRLK